MAESGEAVLLVPLAAGWLTATFMALTMQGWWWPGRQVVVVLPCAVLGVLALAARSRRVAVAMVALGVAGVVEYLWLMVEGLRHSLTLVVDFMTTTDPLYRMWRPFLPDGRSVAGRDLALTAVWAAVCVGVAVVAWVRPRVPWRCVLPAVAAVLLVTIAAGCADDGGRVRDIGGRPGVGRPDTNS